MEKGNTKDQILEVALDLFSVRGYEATSISQIADAVGLRKASLCKIGRVLFCCEGEVLNGIE